MKKFFANIVFLFGTFALSNAQMLIQPEMYIGATGGVTLSKVGFDPHISQDMLWGTTAGGALRYLSEQNFGIQLELNFAQMGWQEVRKEGATRMHVFARQLNYIEFPFLTHVYFGRKARVFFNLGPQIGLLLGEKSTFFADSLQSLQHTTPPQRKFDYGFAVGAGFSVPIKRNFIQLEIRALYGMNDIYSNRKEDWFQRSNNMQASACLGWFFQTQ